MIEAVVKNTRTNIIGNAKRQAARLGFDLNIDLDVPTMLQERELVETFTMYGYEEDGVELQRQLVVASLRG